jgi:hypothetical protein
MIEKAFLLKVFEKLPKPLAIILLACCHYSWVLFSVERLEYTLSYIAAMFGGGRGLISHDFLYYLRNYGLCCLSLFLLRSPARCLQ